jgi:hypothetical protein
VDLVQDAVDAHTHGGNVAPRLDVHVRRALIERIVQEVLDRGDDMAVGGLNLLDSRQLDETLEVADVDAGVDLLFGRGHGPAEPVEIGDEPLDLAGRRDDEARVSPHERLDVVDEAMVHRVGHCDGNVAIVGGDNEHVVLARERPRDELRRQLGVDLQGVEIHEGEIHRLGERHHDRALAERVALVSSDEDPHAGEHLGRVDVVLSAHPRPRASDALADDPCSLAVHARPGVAPLRRREEPRLLEQLT